VLRDAGAGNTVALGPPKLRSGVGVNPGTVVVRWESQGDDGAGAAAGAARGAALAAPNDRSGDDCSSVAWNGECIVEALLAARKGDGPTSCLSASGVDGVAMADALKSGMAFDVCSIRICCGGACECVM